MRKDQKKSKREFRQHGVFTKTFPPPKLKENGKKMSPLDGKKSSRDKTVHAHGKDGRRAHAIHQNRKSLKG